MARLVDGHLAALVARLAERRVRRGPRALWGLVANGCAAALLEQARAAGLPPPGSSAGPTWSRAGAVSYTHLTLPTN